VAAKDTIEIEILAKDKTKEGFESAQSGLGKLKGIITGLGIAGAVAGVGMALKGVAEDAVKTNAQLETATLQFETLLGSADKAQKHIKDLYDFAAETPFETQPILNASKTLLTFGGEALDTMKNLRKVGDAAAVTGQSIDQVAFWFGRAYVAISSGKPFGEAAARLQEMGIMSAEARAKLEQMQKEGKKSRFQFLIGRLKTSCSCSQSCSPNQ